MNDKKVLQLSEKSEKEADWQELESLNERHKDHKKKENHHKDKKKELSHKEIEAK